MTKEELYELCCKADSVNSAAYASLCEEEITDEEFIQRLKDIVN